LKEGISSDNGFSLLEVVIALTILAGGFLVVLQLYSMSVRSVGTSGKYLKGTMLAQSKMAELELVDFDSEQVEGIFESEKDYRWKVEILPYASQLNNEEEGIQLLLVKLKVFWEENGNVFTSSLDTIRLSGSTYPISDLKMAELFKGGRNVTKPNDRDLDTDEDPTQNSSPPYNNC
jgi:prepilin-type N-terminal cleavage/methylation domain-containing protein